MVVPVLWMTIIMLLNTVKTRENIMLRKQQNISERGNSFSCVSFASAPQWMTAVSPMCRVLPVRHNTRSRLLLEFMKSCASDPPSIPTLSMAGGRRGIYCERRSTSLSASARTVADSMASRSEVLRVWRASISPGRMWLLISRRSSRRSISAVI